MRNWKNFYLNNSKKRGKLNLLIPATFPYLTTENLVVLLLSEKFAEINNLSATSFVAPYKLIGFDALSVESIIDFFTLALIDALIIFSVLNISFDKFRRIIFSCRNLFKCVCM